MRTMFVVFAQSTVLAGSAVAQHSSPSAPSGMSPAPTAPFADSTEIRNVPGHRGAFALPQTYGQCVAALVLARHEVAVRDASQDTIAKSLQLPQPLSPAQRTLGEACRARIQVQQASTTVPASPELQSALELAIMLGDSAGSTAALDRWLAAPSSLGDRGESAIETRIKRLYTAVHLFLDVQRNGALPDWCVAQARSIIGRFDAMGPDAHAPRLATQQTILDAQIEWRNRNAGRFVEPERVLHDYLTLLTAFDSASASVNALVNKYEAGVGLFAIGIEQAQDLIDPARTLPLLDSIATHSSSAGEATRSWATIRRADFAFYQSAVPKLQADFWYKNGGDAVWPVPGHMSLLLWGPISSQDAPLLRKLARRYGPHGLRITIIDKTVGYWNRSGTETGPRTAAQEAAQDSAYYLGYLKLPVTVAVAQSQFKQFPDGHYEQAAPLQFERELVPMSRYASMLLVDPNGHLVDTWAFEEAYMVSKLDHLFEMNDK